MKHTSRLRKSLLASVVVCAGASFFLAATGYAASVRTPTFSPTSPYLGLGTTVTISDTTSGATIKYCTDTNNTCTPATTYSTGIVFDGTTFKYIRAQGILAGDTSSSVVSWNGTIGTPLPPAAPTFVIAMGCLHSRSTSIGRQA
jgi:hypothetical protein